MPKVDPNIVVPTTTSSQGLPTQSPPCKHVRFADDVIQEKKSSSKPLVSPPVQPTGTLLERLYGDIATLPMTWQEALMPAQLCTLARRGEVELEKLEAVATLGNMRRGSMGVVAHHGVCSEPLERSVERRSPEDTPEVSPGIVLQSTGEGQEMDPETKAARKVKTPVPTTPENGTPSEIEASPEKTIPRNNTSLEAHPRKMPKATPKTVQSRQRSPTKITLHLTTPRRGISKTTKASPRKFGQVHGSADKRNLELAWLRECKKAKSRLAAWHAQAGI